MNPRESRTSSKLYASIFLSLIICIIVTIVALSSALYANFEKIALSNLYVSEKNSLSQTSYSAKTMIDNSTNYMLQIYSDPQFDKLLHYASPGIAETHLAVSRLNAYLNLNYFFHSIYLYSKNSKTFYFASTSQRSSVERFDDFFDEEARALVRDFSRYKPLAPIPRVIPVQTPFQERKTANVYTFLFHDLQGESKDLDNTVILNVPERWMKEAITHLDVNKSGSTFIIDGRGVVVTSTGNLGFLADLSSKPYVRKILEGAAAQASDYLMDDVDGVKSLVVYSKHELTGWIFVRVLSYDTIMGKIESMKKTVLLICFVILLVGLTISYLLSRTLYKPIDKVFTRLNALMKEKQNHQPQLKQNYLRQLLRSSENRKPSAMEAELREYGIAMDPASDFAVLLLRIDRFEAFACKYSFKDRVLLRYGIMNIASECFTPVAGCECVELDERTIAVLLNGDFPDHPDWTDPIRTVQDSTEKYLGLSISVSVSRTGGSLVEVSELHAEALRQLDHLYVEGHRCVLDPDRHRPLAIKPFSYPSKLENNMLETIKLGKAQESKKWLDEFIDSVDAPSYAAYNLLFNQLAFTMSTAALAMDKNMGLAAEYDFGSFIQKMHQLETLQEVREHFGKLIDQMCAGFREKKSSKHDNLAESVENLIRQHYADRDMSLYKLAEMLDLSPAYLGRLYKKLTMKSVPDCLNEYRIARAKELLLKTNDSIEGISQKTGYNNNNYFYKVFKKYTGVTPAEYRNNGA